jgi:hypothetical protein
VAARFVAVLAAVSALAAPGLAQARWLRAESPRFVVYSDGGEAELREYTEGLEAFDRILRFTTGLPETGVPPRKLDVYLVKTKAGLQRVWPSADDRVAGFYSASSQDIFAVAIRGEDATVTQHEYTHHFMYQYFPYGYPVWLVEGFAEYFMTTTFRGPLVEVGAPGDRARELVYGTWIPLEAVLGKPLDQIPPDSRSIFYGESWALTHYLLSDPKRSRQLLAYMKAVGAGGDPVSSMQAATGQDIKSLEKTLRTYIRQGLKYTQYKRIGWEKPAIEVTALPPSADELLLEVEQIRHGVEEKAAPALLARIRATAARFPGDRLAQVGLARAEVTLGERKTGEVMLTAWLAGNPKDIEALQLIAQARMAKRTGLTSGRSMLRPGGTWPRPTSWTRTTTARSTSMPELGSSRPATRRTTPWRPCWRHMNSPHRSRTSPSPPPRG